MCHDDAMRIMKTAGSLAAIVVATLGLAACNSDATPTTSGSAFDPAAAASWIRAQDGVAIQGQTKLGRQTGPIDGQIRYEPYAVDSNLTVAASSTELARVRYLRTGDQAWVKGQTRTKTTTASLNSALLLYRPTGGPPYLEAKPPDAGVFARLSVPFDPARLLDSLAQKRVRFSEVSATGDRRYRARLPRALAQSLGVQTVSTVVADRNQPSSIGFTSVDGARSRYTLRQFRGPLSVTPPAPESVQVTNKPPPDATGPYVTVATVSVGSTSVEIARANVDGTWECWKVVSEPPFVGIDDPRPSGGYCTVRVNDRSEDEAYSISLDAHATLPYELLGIVFPPGTQATITTVGGTKPMAISPEGLAYFAGPADEVALLVEATTPAGRKLVCGPGSINNRAGVLAVEAAGAATPDPVVGLPMRSQPWNCLPQDLADSLGAPGAG